MGDAKRKRNRRLEYLAQHPRCVYCGSTATTSDHFPPRTLFSGRQWPETYEFPACEPCNSSARLDEQAVALLFRGRLRESSAAELGEWERLLDGVRNNQPQIIEEWTSLTRNEIKNGLRDKFGRNGDILRNAGYGLIKTGPHTKAIITRFMIKLAKALYYKHNGAILDGVSYIHHIDLATKDTNPNLLESILEMAPSLAEIKRNNTALLDQFIYRFNNSAEHGVIYAVVQFGEQFIFQIIALNRRAEHALLELQRDKSIAVTGRHECYLQTPWKNAEVGEWMGDGIAR